MHTATVSTLKQQRAATKAAKQQRQSQRAAKAKPATVRPAQREVERLKAGRIQAAYRQSILNGNLPPMPDEERQQAYRINLFWRDQMLSGQQTLQAYRHLSHLCRAFKIAVLLYNVDEAQPLAEHLHIAQAAAAELLAYTQNPQGRLPWLLELINAAERLCRFMPNAAIYRSGIYNSALHILLHFEGLLQEERAAELLAVTQGISLNTLAAAAQTSSHQLRQHILSASQWLYHIGSFASQSQDIRPAQNIPDLRQRPWCHIGHWHTLLETATLAEIEAHRFEQETGIGLLEWDEYLRDSRAAIQTIGQRLNAFQAA